MKANRLEKNKDFLIVKLTIRNVFDRAFAYGLTPGFRIWKLLPEDFLRLLDVLVLKDRDCLR